ncbi:MAG: response regulator [Rhodothermales bacterium]
MQSPQPTQLVIVDDDHIDQRAIGRLLDPSCTTVFFDTANAALQHLQEHVPDCILLDYCLPDADGFALLEHIQRQPLTQYTPVIITSGEGNERIAAQAIQAGASDYLPKAALTPSLLRQSIAQAIKQRHMAHELDETHAALRRANAELEAFSHFIAHDLKSPLQAIQGYVDLIGLHNPDLSDDSKKWMNVVDAQAQRIGTLVDTLYQLAHAKWNAIEAEPIDLAAVVADVRNTFAFELKVTDTTFAVDNLPVVNTSPILVRQVLQNLISNAIKYQSERSPYVGIHSTDEDSHVAIHVSDHGIGIPKDRLPYIFDAFERAVDADSYHGLGIGLAFCRKIVQALGGAIRVASVEGKGTTFTFTLPKSLD